METEDSQILGIIAAGSAVIAALAAWWSARSSHQAEIRAGLRDSETNPNLQLYLADSFRVFSAEVQSYIYAFSLSLNNLSDANISITRFELEVECHKKDSQKAIFIFQHNKELVSFLPQETLDIFGSNCGLGSYGTKAAWLLFKLPLAFCNENIIDKYRVLVPNTRGSPAVVTAYIVKEIHEA